MSIAAWYVVCRWVHFMAVMQVFGVGCFAGFLAPEVCRQRIRRELSVILRHSVIIALFSALALMALQAALMGGGWPDSIRPPVWLAVMQTSFGHIWRYQLLSGVLMLGCLPQWQGRERAACLLAAFTLITLAWTGHAAMNTGISGVLHRVNNSAHLLCAGFWLGCLYPFWLLVRDIRREPADAAPAAGALIRFSFYGHLAVVGVILSGIFNGILLSAWQTPPWHSAYYAGLWLKVILVMAITAIAVYNRYYLVPRMRHEREQAMGALLRNCAWQLILMLSVLFVVSFFATLSPH